MELSWAAASSTTGRSSPSPAITSLMPGGTLFQASSRVRTPLIGISRPAKNSSRGPSSRRPSTPGSGTEFGFTKIRSAG